MTEDPMPHPTDTQRDTADPDSALPLGSVADYDPARPVFAVPHRPLGERFVGREAALEQVRQRLSDVQRAAIVDAAGFQGLGGLGKTQLAVEYAYRYRDHYPNGVIWLSADRDLDGQLSELAVTARWIAPESEHRYKLEIARHRLRSVGDCLIVFDNLEDLASIRDYLPEAPAVSHVLVTSRAGQKGFEKGFASVPIDLLDRDQSLTLLTQAAGRAPDGEAEQEVARDMVCTLDGLPIALDLAGACLGTTGMGFGDYLQLLRHQLSREMPSGLGDFGRHETHLLAVMDIGANAIARESLLPAVLDVLAWSGAAPMGRDLLAALVGVADCAELAAALDSGTAAHLVRPVLGTDRYEMHPLLRALRRAAAPMADRPEWATELCGRIDTWFSALLGDLPKVPLFESALDHLREWQGHAARYAPGLTPRLSWLQIYVPLQRGQPTEIRLVAERALNECKEHKCEDQALVASLCNDFAYALDALGDPKHALKLAEQALAIRRELFGENHPETARSLGNMANYSAALGNQERALELAEQSLAIRRGLFGERHRDTIAALGNVATYTYNLGRPLGALELAEQALEHQRALSGDRHPDTAASLVSVAFFTNGMRKPEQALELAEQALAIQRGVFGDRHPETATSLGSMATYASALGDQQRALELAQQALAIQQTLFGPRHPATAKCMHNAARYLSKLGKANEAHVQAKTAYDIFRQVLGATHPQTLSTAKLLGSIRRPGFRIPSFKKGGGGKSAKARK